MGGQGKADPVSAPGQPRDAASVLVLRDPTEGPPEVLMIRRHEGSSDFAGASVFPGGNVEPGDAAPDSTYLSSAKPHELANVAADSVLSPDSPGFDLARARRELGEAGPDAEIRALHVAACRELEEEAGIHVTVTALIAFARWVTPAHVARRWDTRFFFCAAPANQTARADGSEASEVLWTTARGALEDYAAGRHVLAPPTLRLLHELERFASAAEAFEGARRSPGVFPALPVRLPGAPFPTLVFPGDREHPEHPGDGLDRVVLKDGRWTWSGNE